MAEGLSRGWLGAVSTILVLCGCSGSDRPGPAQSSGGSIGPAGGTVSGPSGARVVIPAGALSSPTPIAVTQSDSGLPVLPPGVVPFGPIFSFTPHGTQFAVPVSTTVPFDPALVPPGTQPVLYKTNPAMTGWAPVPSATASGGTMTGAVRSFSGEFVGPLPPPPLEKGTPHKTWNVRELQLNGHYLFTDEGKFRDDGEQDGGILEKDYDLGPGTMLDPSLPLPDLLPREFRSNGRIFSSAGGGSYAVSGEAPKPKVAEDRAGNLLFYSQTQSYRKNDPNAKLSLHITLARIETVDDAPEKPLPCNLPLFDPELSRCDGEMTAEVKFTVQVYKDRFTTLFRGAGALRLRGWHGHWNVNTRGDFADEQPLWDLSSVDFVPDVDLDRGSHARLALKGPLTVPIDLSSVGKDEEFTVFVRAQTFVFDGRTGGERSYLGAFFRDPTRIDGDPQLITEGLDPTDRPESEPDADDPSLPPECRTRPSAGRLEFLSPTYEALEGAGPAGVSVLVVRADGTAGEVSATLATSDGTATAPDDYQSVRTSIAFADGDSAPQLIRVPLVYSTDAEPDKTFTVTLTQPTGCATLGEATTVVTILDDTSPVPPSQTFTVSGTVSGLSGTGLVLRNVLAPESVTVASDGPFTFPTPRLDGSAYDVRVDTQPSNPLQTCTVASGTGTVSGANVTSIAVTCTTPAAPGSLDPSFGDSGRAVTGVAYTPNLLGARIGVALQGDGKILLVGGLKLLRLNTDGTLDANFGTAGVVNVVFDNGALDTAMDVAVQGNGKIVVAGTTSTFTVGSDNFALTRFNSDGTLDTTFGPSGHTTTDFFGSTDQVRRMRLQDDGKILVVGFAIQPISPTSGAVDFAIARYNADGTPDLTFSADGRTTDSPGNSFSIANGLTIQTDGKIVVAGSTAPNGGDDADTGLVRYLGDGQVKLPGTRDDTFGPRSNGTLEASLGADDQAVDVVTLADGTILAAVRVNSGITSGASAFGLAHIPAGGVPAPRFPQPIITFTTQADSPRSMLKQADGKIVVVGQSGNQGTNPDMAIVRLDNTGFTPDPSFGTDGKLTVDFFGAIDGAEDVVQQADGKLVVGGFARSGSATVFAAVRVAQ